MSLGYAFLLSVPLVALIIGSVIWIQVRFLPTEADEIRELYDAAHYGDESAITELHNRGLIEKDHFPHHMK